MNTYKVQRGRPHTHTSLAGGLYNSDLGQYNQFLQDYLNTYKKKQNLYLSERIPKGKTFRFFMDLDFPQRQNDTPSELRKFYREIYTGVSEVLNIVTKVIKLSVRLRKIHVHCPELIVNSSSALVVFERVKARLSSLECTNAEKIYDKSVYKSGLRMLGSLKPAKSDKDPEWVKVKEYRLLDDDFEELRLDSDDEESTKLQWLRDTSIFNLDSAPLTVLPWTPPTQNSSKKNTQTAQVKHAQSPEHSEEINDSARDVLENFVLSRYHHQPPRILRIKRHVDNNIAYLLVELDELYCPFMKRCHKSNRQYIIINEKSSVQKCHDESCKDKRHEELKFEDMTATVRKAITECCSPGTPLDPELVKAAEDEAKENLGNHIPEDHLPLCMTLERNGIYGDLQKNTGIFQDHLHCDGTLMSETTAEGTMLTCNKCNYRWPRGDMRMSIGKQYANLNKVLIIVNNLTVNNITNNYNGDNADLDVSFDKMYNVFDNQELNALIYRALDGTSSHLVELFHFLAKDRFIHGESPKEPWYEFVQPRWEVKKTGVFDFIPNILIEKLQIIKEYYSRHQPDGNMTQKQVTKITGIIKSLLENKKHVIEQDAIPKFAKKDFIQTLDSKRTVLGFNDGVYDFETKSFREGRSDDYISLNVGYDFPKESNVEIRKQILKFFEDIQPEPSERKYLLTFLSTLIHGDNKEEAFHIFTGTTRNGKSLLSDLLRATLGDYHTSFAANMLTKERPPPSQPQPDILYLKSKRVAIGSEPENGQKINSGYMKYITGNDIITARGLYENTITEFKPQFKLILLCNTIPLMDSNDDGVWSRSRIVNFPTTFVDEPKLPHEKKIDRTLKDRVKEWGSEFMLMLIQIYHDIYKMEGLITTTTVMSKTIEYQEESNHFIQYVNERITRVSDLKQTIALGVLVEDFNQWAQEAGYIGVRVTSPKHMSIELKRLGIIVPPGTQRCAFSGKSATCATGIRFRNHQ